jgi:hypothetical protein
MKHRIGRVQRACWRALVAAGGKELRRSDILDWCYPRRPGGAWQRSSVASRTYVRRAVYLDGLVYFNRPAQVTSVAR